MTKAFCPDIRFDMKMEIYPLVVKHSGKAAGKEFLALVELMDNGVRIECYDSVLKTKLIDFFSQPLIKIIPEGSKDTCLSYKEEVVMPFTEDFFYEALYSLHKLGLTGKLEE